MIGRTLMIGGPSGIGKSFVDRIVKPEAVRVDPYRLRADGPRKAKTNKLGQEEKDLFYSHPKIRDELSLTFQRLGLSRTCLSQDVHWYQKAMTVFFRVRNDWQLLFLEGLEGQIGKGEIYAPVLQLLLSIPAILEVFGEVTVVILNPVEDLKKESLPVMKQETRKNCENREDEEENEDEKEKKRKKIEERVNSIAEEYAAWAQMDKEGAIVVPNWEYAEHKYYKKENGKIVLDEHWQKTLVEARTRLVEKSKQLEVFFKTADEIERQH